MIVLLAALCLADLVIGAFHVWALLEIFKERTFNPAATGDLAAIAVTAAWFIVPAIAWGLRQRALMIALAFAALPIAIFAATGGFEVNFRIKSEPA